MNEAILPEYKRWIVKAEDDERSIHVLVQEEAGAPSTVCFLAQQMAEKYLKCCVVFYKIPLRKIHDLIMLETVLKDVVSDIEKIHDALVILNQYYIETRYPVDYPEFTWKEAREAYALAKRVKEVVLNSIEDH